MSNIPSEPEMSRLESALRALSPAPSRLDRDRLMFEAGALARGRTGRLRWLWPSAAALLAVVVALESTLLVSRPTSRVFERLVVIREPSISRSSDAEPTAAIQPSDIASPHRESWGDPSRAILPARWATVADARWVQECGLGLGLDGLAEPDRMTDSGRPASGPPSRAASVGELRSLELERIFNPGDRS
jgi:hypothetical protein